MEGQDKTCIISDSPVGERSFFDLMKKEIVAFIESYFDSVGIDRNLRIDDLSMRDYQSDFHHLRSIANKYQEHVRSLDHGRGAFRHELIDPVLYEVVNLFNFNSSGNDLLQARGVECVYIFPVPLNDTRGIVYYDIEDHFPIILVNEYDILTSVLLAEQVVDVTNKARIADENFIRENGPLFERVEFAKERAKFLLLFGHLLDSENMRDKSQQITDHANAHYGDLLPLFAIYLDTHTNEDTSSKDFCRLFANINFLATASFFRNEIKLGDASFGDIEDFTIGYISTIISHEFRHVISDHKLSKVSAISRFWTGVRTRHADNILQELEADLGFLDFWENQSHLKLSPFVCFGQATLYGLDVFLSIYRIEAELGRELTEFESWLGHYIALVEAPLVLPLVGDYPTSFERWSSISMSLFLLKIAHGDIAKCELFRTVFLRGAEGAATYFAHLQRTYTQQPIASGGTHRLALRQLDEHFRRIDEFSRLSVEEQRVLERSFDEFYRVMYQTSAKPEHMVTRPRAMALERLGRMIAYDEQNRSY